MKRLARIVGLAAGVILGTSVVFLVLLEEVIMPSFVSVDSVHAPQLVGRSLDEARERTREKGLRLAVLDSAYHDTAPRGQIIDQTPGVRGQIKQGRRVFVSLSRGQRLYTVPEVAGGSERDALLQIHGRQLTVGRVRYRSSGSIPEGAVISQDPAPGTPVPRTTPVHLEVSSGSPFAPKLVPDLVGMPIEEVETVLDNYEMRLGELSERVNNSALPGQVLAQDPAGGSRAPRGTAVRLVVSAATLPRPPQSPSGAQP